MKQHESERFIADLNTVSRLCAVENYGDARSILKLMTEVLRYEYHRRFQLVPIGTELRAAEDFLSLYTARFADRLVSSVSNPEDGTVSFVPHYTVLTFVKNSLYHAFTGTEPPWRVSIRVEDYQNQTTIVISDNGCGFDPSLYVGLDRSPIEQGSDTDYGSIPSTVARLASYYGDRYSLDVQSTSETGTQVVISVPKG